MSKIAILGDLHLGVHKGHPAFSNALKTFMEELFIPTLERENITSVVQLGDIVDRPTGIRFVDMVRLRNDFIEPLLSIGVTLHVLVGNHDAPYNRDTLTPSAPTELFNGYPDIIVYDKPEELTYGGIDGLKCVMLPWICRENAIASISLLKRTKCKVVFGHLELNGFDMHRGVTCHEGMDSGIFKDFNLVVSGHFHQSSKQGIIQYTGAPCQLTWADSGCQRGFWILDTETLEMRFIPNPNNMYVELIYADDVMYYEGQYRDKFVKVIVKSKKDQLSFDTFMKNIEDGAIEVKIIEQGIDFESSLQLDENKYQLDDSSKIFGDYVDGLTDNPTLNKIKLKSILSAIHSEALNVN